MPKGKTKTVIKRGEQKFEIKRRKNGTFRKGKWIKLRKRKRKIQVSENDLNMSLNLQES